MKTIPAVILALGLLAGERAFAFNPQPDPPGFGMIGLCAGQSLRINVANVDLPALNEFPPGPCRVEIALYDELGNLLLPAVEKTLTAGRSTHIDLNGDDVLTRDLMRREVRPSVRLLSNTTRDGAGLLPPGPCRATVELFDNQTGRTLVTLGPDKPGEAAGFNPQPEPPGNVGQVAIVAGQVARLNAVNLPEPGRSGFPPGPCRVELILFNGDGAVLKSSTTILRPGEATSLDFAIPADATAAGRIPVRGVMLVSRAGRNGFPPGPCRTTLEVFDQASGKTSVVMAP